MELSAGSMETNTRVNSRLITSKDTADISGSMVVSSKVFGKTTRCTERVPLFGVMAENTRVNMSVRKKKDMESSLGLTGVATRVNGKMANRMVRVFTGTKKEWSELEFGQTARKLNGLIDKFMLLLAM